MKETSNIGNSNKACPLRSNLQHVPQEIWVLVGKQEED